MYLYNILTFPIMIYVVKLIPGTAKSFSYKIPRLNRKYISGII